jgi:cell division protein FtsL
MCHIGTSQGTQVMRNEIENLKKTISDQTRLIEELKRTVEDLSRKVK